MRACVCVCACVCVLVCEMCVCLCLNCVCVCVAVTALCFWQYFETRGKDETYTFHMGFVMTFSKETFFLTMGLWGFRLVLPCAVLAIVH